ncbi:MAG TPA: response regulator [Bdellovibrionales bacterium]|nr:MAG: histidine kinase [Bdellovibrionales bacterium GWA1_52_35]OFZ34936.1 MAG: histidine kinase [Bdellovibrionales bacterium GWC1_52_8]HAR42407.1 response regulator [Bdellovibrionales bacterium]HCM40668.1 response regulator [Bdellovibrionales bacterium]
MSIYADLRVLVVDDMLTMRKIIGQQLKTLGATNILEANDGTTAWEVLERESTVKPIQFIISDWNMPQMKGIDLLKKCRAHPVYKDVAFLMVTAEAEVTQVKEAVGAGVDNYVVKPFTPAAFEEKMKAVYTKRFGAK